MRTVLPDFNEVGRCKLAGGKGPPCQYAVTQKNANTFKVRIQIKFLKERHLLILILKWYYIWENGRICNFGNIMVVS